MNRRQLSRTGAVVVLALAALAFGGAVASEPMTYAQFQKLEQPKAELRVAYGAGPQQFGELWLPRGAGPHPVVVMIHGGCWQASVADLSIMNLLADDLRRRGIAVWNIEYRGVDQPGGGYPGTFQDMTLAVDRLRTEAPKHRLKLDRVVAVGHSAGGHLALWAAGRGRLPRGSPFRTPDPLRIDTVVSLGGLADLEALLEPGTHGCEIEAIRQLAGPPTAERPDPFADTSPAELLPLGVKQITVHAAQDFIAPVKVGEAYAAKARAAGDLATLTVLEGAGHFELIAPGTPAWTYVAGLIAAEFR